MVGLRQSIGLAVAVLAFGFAEPVAAQENLDSGKTPAQLFASDCAICHKTTQGLSKGSGVFGLKNFLREHYTASRETAAAIAAYVEATDKGPGPNKRGTSAKRKAKTDTKLKKDEGKADEKKTESKKPGDDKADEAKAGPKLSEPKASEPKPSETKPIEAKPGESKPTETKSADRKPSESKATTSTSGDGKADVKPDAKSGEQPKSD
jgi:hypothetical protein